MLEHLTIQLRAFFTLHTFQTFENQQITGINKHGHCPVLSTLSDLQIVGPSCVRTSVFASPPQVPGRRDRREHQRTPLARFLACLSLLHPRFLSRSGQNGAVRRRPERHKEFYHKLPLYLVALTHMASRLSFICQITYPPF